MIACLRELCRANGGPEGVAAAAEVSSENLKQILNGTKLPSGNPKGVGPALQRKLTAAFPNWLSIAAEPAAQYRVTKSPTLDEALSVVAMHLGAANPEAREAIAINMAGWAREGGASHWTPVISALLATNARKLAA